jgi:AcrR family transcriptional regulator
MARARGRYDAPSKPNGDADSVSTRRDEILEIASELFATQGYVGTSTRDIGNRANILSGSLFHHFDTKDQIVDELIRPYFDEMLVRTRKAVNQDARPDVALMELIRSLIDLMGEGPQRARILHNDWQYLATSLPYLAKGMSELERLWLKLLRRGVSQGVLRDDVDVRIAYLAMLAGLSDITRWYQPDGPKSIEEIADVFVKLYVSGLKARR